ncbi:MAG: tRNA (adenosine(37)-N6)-threonylcarbamoyltransferase complex transferase subunit TsaD [Candidatus Sericytochromatia bacterium]|nr:tRNA (adenosine(37)-N6)-threonylcarbamoyltransferase complex transferase subunit TsaD [Candidatus Sericytochromatia bacterium]
MSPIYILGIETSCDETSVAIVRDGHEILVNLVSSQIDLHRRFGGVVPEVASRQHILTLNPLIAEALEIAQVKPADLTAVAATHAPGLMGALLVGLVSAKAAAWALDRPFIGVHHLAAHIWANVMANPQLPLPFLCLLVSGGHTALVQVAGPRTFETLGETLDDAVGEAYDKVARLLGLPYPGGPEIDRRATEGDPKAFNFPRALLHEPELRFSLSGVKTAVRRTIEKHSLTGLPLPVNDISASFQAAVVDVLVAKTIAAAEMRGLRTVAVAGGVAANRELRQRLDAACRERGWHFAAPPLALCSDNAAMIAGLAHALYLENVTDKLTLRPQARLPL